MRKMELKEMYCPECGEKVKVDANKEVNFCTNCGNKIVMSSSEKKIENTSAPTKQSSDGNADIEEKLKEIQFYYETSRKKKEGMHTEKNPFYYLKAQDALLDLTEQYPDDYRIWWEISKPLDYMCEEECGDYEGRYKFNEQYFDSAIDKADIDAKKKLIQQFDSYNQKKKQIKNKREDDLRRAEEEKKEEERKREEARKEQERKQEEARKEQERKREQERLSELKRQKDIEQRTVRGYEYKTLEEADLARKENAQIDALKARLMPIKKQEKRKELFENENLEIKTWEANERYKLLKQKVYTVPPKAEKYNLIYGITVLISFVIYMIGGLSGNLATNPVVIAFAVWGSFGVWIWTIWKIVLFVKSKKKEYYKNISNI